MASDPRVTAAAVIIVIVSTIAVDFLVTYRRFKKKQKALEPISVEGFGDIQPVGTVKVEGMFWEFSSTSSAV